MLKKPPYITNYGGMLIYNTALANPKLIYQPNANELVRAVWALDYEVCCETILRSKKLIGFLFAVPCGEPLSFKWTIVQPQAFLFGSGASAEGQML